MFARGAANFPSRRLAPALVVLLASPMIAELLTSSAPPGVFFIPWVFALFVGFYGLGALLAHEAAARWHGGWATLLLLGCGFGILQEGVAAKSFFDPAWRALGPLRDHGRVGGVNAVWSFAITLFHAAYSVAIPVLLARLVVADHARGPWLGRIGLGVVAVLFGVTVAIFHTKGNAYEVPGALTLAALVVTVLFALLARGLASWRVHRTRGEPNVAVAAALGAGAGTAWLVGCFAVPLVVPPLATAAWFALVATLALALLARWNLDPAAHPAQVFALIAGALAPYVVLGPYQEVNPTRADDASGMGLVSLATVVLLVGIGVRIRRGARGLGVGTP